MDSEPQSQVTPPHNIHPVLKEPPEFRRLKSDSLLTTRHNTDQRSNKPLLVSTLSDGALSINPQSNIFNSTLALQTDSIYWESDTHLPGIDYSSDGTTIVELAIRTCWLCKKGGDLILACKCEPECGLVHRECLISWMNTLCKGRCPYCTYQYHTTPTSTTWVHWQVDPVSRSHRTKYIGILALNVLVTAVFIVSMLYILSFRGSDKHVDVRVTVGVGLGCAYLGYLVYQGKLFSRVYERVKMYNNRVRDVIVETELSSTGPSGLISTESSYSEIKKHSNNRLV